MYSINRKDVDSDHMFLGIMEDCYIERKDSHTQIIFCLLSNTSLFCVPTYILQFYFSFDVLLSLTSSNRSLMKWM